MAVTSRVLSHREELLAQIDRLVKSSVLHGSESLCKLLRYLAEHSLDHPGAPLKEYQIATEVFGRPGSFDPRLDSTVRVQTGRLRSKLAEYYAGAGAEDPIVVEVPKGSYALLVQPRPAQPLALKAEPVTGSAPVVSVAATPELTRVSQARLSPWILLISALAIIFAVAFGVVLYVLLARRPAETARLADPALVQFWSGFIEGPDEPWVVFSNAEFVGRPETGMRYFDARRDSKDQVLDHYSGVGEVLAVHELDRVFTALRRPLRVKRGRLLSLDDAKHNDLIFVGSPSENLRLTDMPATREFAFQRVPSGPRQGDLAIAALQAGGDERAVYLASPGTHLTEDYALIALMPGLNQSHLNMILAGITTIGTQAAVEYVCRAASVKDLLTRLDPSPGARPPPFEAVLRIKVSGGVPVESTLIALHKR